MEFPQRLYIKLTEDSPKDFKKMLEDMAKLCFEEYEHNFKFVKVDERAYTDYDKMKVEQGFIPLEMYYFVSGDDIESEINKELRGFE